MNDTALLIIDVQNIMFGPGEPVHESERLLSNLRTLIDRAHASAVPVVYVQHNGPEDAPHAPGGLGWPIHPSIAPRDGETVVQKSTPDSFLNTTLNDELSKRGIKRLITAGIQTDYCVDTTVRRAFSEGYEVVLVSDAHSTWGDENASAEQVIAHHNRVLGDWFAKLMTTDEVRF